MANELLAITGETDKTLFALLSDMIGRPYNSDSLTFESWSDSNLADYVIETTEQGSAARYAGNMPAVAPGAYSVTFYEQQDVDPALGDLLFPVFIQSFDWDGSAVISLDSAVRRAATFTVLTDVGNTPSVVLSDLTETLDDVWKDYLALVLDGDAARWLTSIAGYNGTTKQVQFERAPETTLADGVRVALYYVPGVVGSSIRQAIYTADRKVWVGPQGGVDLDDDAFYGQMLRELFGLHGANCGVRDQAYDGNDQLLTANVFLYDSPENAAVNDGVTGKLHQYEIVSTWDGAKQLTETTARVS